MTSASRRECLENRNQKNAVNGKEHRGVTIVNLGHRKPHQQAYSFPITVISAV